MKIDHRKHYIIVLDTETANTFRTNSGELDTSSTLVYDLGWQITDKRGNIYGKRSFVISDIFFDMSDLMQSAYYAGKIPQYINDIANGSRLVRSFFAVRRQLIDDMQTYNIDTVCAHNARFDVNSLNATMRYLTKSKCRYFFPYGTEIWDSLMMARSVLGQRKTYQRFCSDNDYLTKQGKPRYTAEIIYRYLSNNNDFVESHTGLQDVEIETQIVKACFASHKKMKKVLYPKG